MKLTIEDHETITKHCTILICGWAAIFILACILTLITGIVTKPEITDTLADDFFFFITEYTVADPFEEAAVWLAESSLILIALLAAVQLFYACFSIYRTRTHPAHWSEYPVIFFTILLTILHYDLTRILANSYFGPASETAGTFSDLTTVTFILAITLLCCYILRGIINTFFEREEEEIE